jgi:hypothetical protein
MLPVTLAHVGVISSVGFTSCDGPAHAAERAIAAANIVFLLSDISYFVKEDNRTPHF